MKSLDVEQVSGLILILLITLPPILSTSILDKKLNKWNSVVSFHEQRLSNYLQLATYKSLRVTLFELMKSTLNNVPTNKRVSLERENIPNAAPLKASEEELYSMYEEGKINEMQFFALLGNLSRQEQTHYSKRVQEEKNLINALRAKPPKSLAIKNYLYIIQYIGVTLLFFIRSYRLRKKRTDPYA